MGRRIRSSQLPASPKIIGPSDRSTGPFTIVVGIATLAILTGVGYWIIYPMWATDSHLRQAKSALVDDDFPSAERHIKRVLDTTPDHAEATFLLAQVYRRTERYSAARKQLEQAKRRDWISEYIDLEKLLLSLVESGPTGPAVTQARLYIDASHPEDRLLFDGLVKCYLDAHMLNEAATLLDRWVSRYPDDWLARFRRAEVREATLNTDDAVADYRYVIDHRPNHPTARRKLAEIHLAARTELDEGARLFEEQLRLHPDDVDAQVGLAELKNTIGQPDAALQLVGSALLKNPDMPRAMTLKANLIRAKNPQAAYDLLEKVRVLQPDDALVVLSLGQIAGELGRADDAAKYRTLHTVIDAEKKKQTELAIEVRSRPRDPEVRRQIGQSLIAVGREKEALPWLFSALREDNSHIPTHETLATFYEGKGANPQEAARHRQVIAMLKTAAK